MKDRRQMLAMVFIWMLMWGGCFASVEGAQVEDIEQSFLLIEGLEASYLKGVSDLEVDFEVKTSKAADIITVSCNRIIASESDGSVSGNKIADNRVGESVSGNCMEAIPVLAHGDGMYTVVFEKPGAYRITAQNHTGHQTEAEVFIEQDTSAPELLLKSVVNDSGYTVQDVDGIYYFRESLQVEFIVQHQVLLEEVCSPATLIRNDIEIGEVSEICSDRIEESGTYHYTLLDKAYNRAEEVEIMAVKIQDKPKIQISYKMEPVLIEKMAYFQKDPRPVIEVSSLSGIVSVEYRAGEEEYQLLKAYGEDNVYQFGEHTFYRLEQFSEIAKIGEDNVYAYTFRAVDVMGNVTEVSCDFCIDSTTPDTQIFVSYQAADKKNTRTNVQSLIDSAVDWLFGRTSIYFDLYLRDGMAKEHVEKAVSGLDIHDLLEQITTDNGQARVHSLQVIEEYTDFEYQGCKYQGYTQVRGVLSLPTVQTGYLSDCLKINRLKDKAGNITTLAGKGFTGTTILYLDQVAPVLSIDYGDGIVDTKEQRIFYKEDANLKLSLKEAFYHAFLGADKKAVAPKVSVTGAESEKALIGAWSGTKEGAYTELVLPLSEKEQEITYQFGVDYQDGAGNLLEYGKGGAYCNYTLILDKKAPELIDFVIEGETAYQIDKRAVYRNQEGDDVTISLSIDDHAAYWNLDALDISICQKSQKEAVQKLSAGDLEWTDKGRIHRTSFSFDGADGEKNATEYYIMVSYQDRAGNPLINGGVSDGSWQDGVYKSEVFLLDHQAPLFSVSYSPARRLVDERIEKMEEITEEYEYQTPITGYTAYYQEDIQVNFSIIESCKEAIYQGEVCAGLQDCKVVVTGEQSGSFEPEILWREDGEHIFGSFLLTEEDCYIIGIEYQDMAFNQMQEHVVQGSCFTEGVVNGRYLSTDLVLDKTAPVIEFSYTDYKGERCDAINVTEDGRQYFAQPVLMKLTVKDNNLRFQELKEVLQQIEVFDSAANNIKGSSAQRYIEELTDARVVHKPVTLSIPLSTEANYKIFLGGTDLAGNQAIFTEEYVSIDQTKPTFTLSYKTEKTGFLDAIRYRDLEYLFSDGKLSITTTAEDNISGIAQIHYIIIEEDGKKKEKTQAFSPSSQAIDQVRIPVAEEDFKGIVLVEVTDYANNQETQKNGHVVESEALHQKTKDVLLTTLTTPARTIADVDYYNTDIKLQLSLRDTYSGLREVSYTAGKNLSYSVNYAAQKEKEKIIYEYTEDITLSAADNNENEVLVKADYRDHAGHSEHIEQFYHIDITPPVVEVDYDQNTPINGRYYHQARTAVVTIRERNFQAEDVEFIYTNTEGVAPTIGPFQSVGEGDNTLHTCEVVFDADGDYTFTVAFMDMAGNQAAYSRVDEFTIDRTKPEVRVSYDNTQSIHQYYYAKARTATIDILEHNFDVSNIKIEVTAQEGSVTPLVSGFLSQGDHHIAKIFFREDGDYSFTIAGMDFAENILEVYTEDHFVLDQTSPDIELVGIQDYSANNGVVAPLLRFQDTNFDRESVSVEIEGYHNGIQNIKKTESKLTYGIELQFDDFDYTAQMDDLYILKATARDLAGNDCEKIVTFSVNRFGSVYTFDRQTEQLAGKEGQYYTNQEQDIVVTETNVDTLEFREITCNLSGKIRTLTEGIDYTLQEEKRPDGWKQYIYRIDRHNFSEEGSYLLTLYSEDRAKNSSNNYTKGKKIAFVVDKTSPSIVLSGVEDGGQYQENSREITLDIQDNLSLVKAKVILNNTENIYDAEELLALNGRITYKAWKQPYWQTLQVIAYDAAGNGQRTKTIYFLINSDFVVQFFRNPVLFGCFLVSISIIIALGVWKYTIYQRRRHHI